MRWSSNYKKLKMTQYEIKFNKSRERERANEKKKEVKLITVITRLDEIFESVYLASDDCGVCMKNRMSYNIFLTVFEYLELIHINVAYRQLIFVQNDRGRAYFKLVRTICLCERNNNIFV